MKPYDDWKIGDKLRVILGYQEILNLGDIVTITGFKDANRGGNDIVIIDNPRCQNYIHWRLRRFEKVEEEMVKNKEEFNPAKATRDQLREFAKLNKIPGRGAVDGVVALRALVRIWMDKDKPVPLKDEAPKKPSIGDELTKQVDAGGVGTCSYAFEMGDGSYQYQVRDVCHARLPRGHQKVNRIVLNVKGHYDKHKNKEEYKKVIDYMINSSPYAKAFETKNIEDALREGVYLNLEEGCSRLAAAAIGLREFSEYYPRVNVFTEVCKMGFLKKTAHFASQWFQRDGIDKWKFAPPSGGHMSTVYNMNKEHLFKFFKEGFFIDMQEKPMKMESPGYKVFQSIADSPNYRPKVKEQWPVDPETMQQFLNKILGTKVEGNPWANPAEGLSQRQLYRALEVIEENIKG